MERQLSWLDITSDDDVANLPQPIIKVQMVSFLVCKQPKTYILIPSNLSGVEREIKRQNYLEADGSLRFEVAP